MKQITYKDILDMEPCREHHPSKYISKDWSGTILDVLHAPNVAPTEKLWIAYRVLDDKTLRLFAVNCARRALSRIPNPNPRSITACDVAEKFAKGEATKEELNKARAAAYAAATYAYAAADADADAADADAAAAAAVYAAAYAAENARKEERETQVRELIKMVEEGV